MEALRNAKFNPKTNVLEVSPEIPISIQSFKITKLRGILIRYDYLELFEQIFNEQTEATPHAILCGNPGTGKTYFGFYAMHRLMREERSFVYEPTKVGPVWVYLGKKTQTTLNQHIPGTFECVTHHRSLVRYKGLNFVHIVDGHAPSEIIRFRVVLICSPREIHYSELEKHDRGSISFHMPTWSYYEIEKCRAGLFTIPKELVKKLFDLWGGIPRYVLNGPNTLYGI